jgi:antitoxin HicB
MGDMIMVRYADDLVVGFQHESDARRFWDAMRDRLREFSLSLHPDKTRLIEFGRFAAQNCKKRGRSKPGKSRSGLWEVRSNLTHGRIARVIFCVAPEDAADRPGHCPETAKGDRAMKNKHLGSSFDDFLKEEGIHDDTHAHAIKRVLAWQIQEGMTAQGLSKSEMAKRMNTSRAQLDRLLDPENDKVQLDSVQRAAAAIGRKLHLELA